MPLPILTLFSQQVRTALEDKIQSAWKLDGLFPAATNGSGTTPRNVLGLLSSTGSLSERELEITGAADATALIARIHSGTWSAEEVTVAFSKRAVLAHKLVNCLMDVDFEAAVARARELDAYLKETGRLVGPLHGLPVSIKVTLGLGSPCPLSSSVIDFLASGLNSRT